MSLKTIQTNAAPQAIGPYSQAIACGPFLFCSGQLPIDPATGNFPAGDVELQTAQSLKNMRAILEAAGSSMQKVVKTTVFLKNMNDFLKMNAVYEQAFGGHKPARSTVEVARLPKDILVEIECIAAL